MSSRAILRLVSALCLALPCGLAALPGEARACGESISFEVDPRVMLLSQAEGALQTGKPTSAAISVLHAYPDLRTTAAKDAMLARAQRVAALAVVRTEGFLTAGKAFRASTAEERRASLEWAISTLRRLNAEKANTPSLQTELGEALSKLPETQSEALGLLDKLARKDLVTSAHGWAALAKLRGAAGDQEGQEVALKRYEALARRGKAGKAAPAAAPGKNNADRTPLGKILAT